MPPESEMAIPADVMEAARRISREPIADEEGNCLAYFAGSYTEKCVRVVALAMLAERQRCASVLEGWGLANAARTIREGARGQQEEGAANRGELK